MCVLVTGGAGFIGSHIVDLLIDKNYDVLVVDNLSTGNLSNINSKARFEKKDIRDDDLLDLFKKEQPDYVIHQAAQVSVPNSLCHPVFDAHVNVLGTLNVLECCRKTGVQKIVFASSAAVYGNPEYLPVDEDHCKRPIAPYGISKHAVSYYIKMYKQMYGLNYTMLYYANVYGPRQDHLGEGGVVTIFVRRLLLGKTPVVFGDGEQTRDFIYVGDIAAANICAIEVSGSQTVNVSTGTETSIILLYNVIARTVDTMVRPIFSFPREGDIYRSCLDNKKAREVLGWHPEIDLEAGIKKTVEFFRERIEKGETA